jgi:hypothetical protein
MSAMSPQAAARWRQEHGLPAPTSTTQTATAPTSAPAPMSGGGGWWNENAPTAAPDAPAAGGMVPQVETGGGLYPLSSVSGDGLMRPWTTAFAAPTGDEVRQTPGYQFGMNEGSQAILRANSANGTLGTAGVGKALTRYGQDYADTKYDVAYNRKLGEYRQAYDIFNNNQTNQFNRLSSIAGLGQTTASNLGQTGSSYAGNAGNNIVGAGNAAAAGQVGSANAWNGALSNIGNAAMTYGFWRGSQPYPMDERP